MNTASSPFFQRQSRQTDPQVSRPVEEAGPGHVAGAALAVHAALREARVLPKARLGPQGGDVCVIGAVGGDIPHGREQGEGNKEHGQEAEEAPRAARPGLRTFPVLRRNAVFPHSCGTSRGGSSAIAHISSWAAVAAGKSTSSPSFHNRTASSPRPK